MLTFVLIAAAAILVLAMVILAYAANQRKRAGQSGEAEVNSQYKGQGRPTIGRPTGVN